MRADSLKTSTNPVQKNLQQVTLNADQFNDQINSLIDHDYRLAHLFATDDRVEHKAFGVHAILCPTQKNEWLQISLVLPEKEAKYRALTKTVMAAHWYERYMMDMFGIQAEGHPDARRLVHHENMPLHAYPLRKDFAWDTVLKKDAVPYPMHHVTGNGIYEIPVGPIHAGIIEPGHFRFNVAGERIITLEGKLFFTHKGVEKIVEGKAVKETLPFAERVSGDSAAGHALAFTQAVELLGDHPVPGRAQFLRTLVAELERLTMHIHDIANIAGMGTGYTVMAAQGFRIKERLMRLSHHLFGNRFWRGFIIPGGVSRDLTEDERQSILNTVTGVMAEMHALLTIGLKSDGLCERFLGTGILRNDVAKAYGALGIAARASGLPIDARVDHPYGAYDSLTVPVVSKKSGDVFARFMVRVEELDVTFKLIQEICQVLAQKKGSVKTELSFKKGEALAVAEGWRGEILYWVRLDQKGAIDRLAIRDPSFCNWALFGELGPGNIVPDFPLCNKSLNLSYSGTDL